MNIISRISMLGLSAGLFLLTACNTMSVDALKPVEESPTILLRATTTTSAFASLDKILRTDQAKVVEIISQPARGIVSLYEGRLLYFQPHQSASVGQETFNITVGSNTFAVNLSLENNVACAPVAELDQFESKLNTATELNVLANDPIACSTNQVTLSVEIEPIGGIAQVVNGKILYTPKQDFRGTDKFLYKVTENRSGAAAYASVLVSVGKESAGPCNFIVQEDMLTAIINSESGINPLVNDDICVAAGNQIQLSIATAPQNGTTRFDNNGLSLFYKPNSNFVGQDVLELNVCRAPNDCKKSKVQITVLRR